MSSLIEDLNSLKKAYVGISELPTNSFDLTKLKKYDRVTIAFIDEIKTKDLRLYVGSGGILNYTKKNKHIEIEIFLILSEDAHDTLVNDSVRLYSNSAVFDPFKKTPNFSPSVKKSFNSTDYNKTWVVVGHQKV